MSLPDTARDCERRGLAVGVVDVDPARRTRLVAALDRDGLAVVAEAVDVDGMPGNGGGSLDAVVLASDRLGPSELEAIARIREQPLASRAVAVVGAARRRQTHDAVDAGANGIVVEERADECLALAVRLACAGQLTLPEEWRQAAATPVLSVRQRQVLSMVVLGCSNKEIASTLHLTESTVKSHLTAAFKKLGVRSRNEATAVILDPESGLGTGILAISEEEALDGRA